MKTLFISTALIFATAGTASASEVFTNPNIANGLSSVPSSKMTILDDCLSEESSSRAVRACTKVIRAAAPNRDVKARLYTQRALHQMALGRFDSAASDFSRAGRLSGETGLETMGHGFVAMMDDDLGMAREKFETGSQSASVAPLAEYGLGLTHQKAGETDEAREAYERALDLRPQWTAVSEQMETLTPN